MLKILLKTLFAVMVGTVLSFGQAVAAEFTVTVKNLTNGIYFTPLLITAHDRETHLFETGSPASAALQAMAEGGDISGLIEMVGGEDRDTVANPVGDVLPPGGIVSDVYFNTNRTRNRYLSLTAMLLPTNDGFVGLDSLRIPRIPGTYRYYLFGYDAGTEANDEIVNGGGSPNTPGIPADPGSNAVTGGSGVAGTDNNSTVHIHRGVIGNTDPDAGISDLNSTIHRWLNPVAEVVIEVQPRKRQHRDNEDDD